MTALLQCVPDEMNTFVCVESTANGVGGYFYDMWHDAVAGRNDFTPIFMGWFIEPEYSTPLGMRVKDRHLFLRLTICTQMLLVSWFTRKSGY